VQIGTAHDTSEFACDSIRYWWLNYGAKLYPLATSILLLCDGGAILVLFLYGLAVGRRV
jgi:hypothetical protein